MTPVKTDAWLSFESVTKNFLGNTKVGNYVHLINDMLAKLKKLTVQMSIRIHFLFFHLDRFFPSGYIFFEFSLSVSGYSTG